MMRRHRQTRRPASRHALKRFAIKLALIGLSALAQAFTPWGFADALVALASGSVILDIAIALLLRQQLCGADLTYWDEALAFAAVAVVAAFWWHTPPATTQPWASATQHSR
jgi:hypothetical protein